MITAKPPTPLAGSVSIHLPAFKRKRIEQWCEDVAQYLKSGSLCRSVIGHVIEDNRLTNGIICNGSGTKSAPMTGLSGNQRTSTTTTTTVVHSTAASAATATISAMTEMLSIHGKAEPTGNAAVPISNGNNSCFRVTKIDTSAPPLAGGRGGTPMPDASGPLPVVKFSYGHYNEQRRRIDRLVQGLPVLPASAGSAAGATPNQGSAAGVERLSGTGGGAGGEEQQPSSSGPSRAAERMCWSPSRGVSPAPGAAPTVAESARCASRASSTGDPRAQRASRPSGGASHQSRTGPSVSPSPTRSHPVYPGLSSSHHPYPNANNNSNSNGPHTKTSSAEIVVIEDESYYNNHHCNNGFNKAPGFSSLNFDAGNPVLKRTQSQRVHKARQRMLAGTRRSRDTGGHVPVQSCWAMTELTW